MTTTDTAQTCEMFSPLRREIGGNGGYSLRCGQCSRFEHEHGAPQPREIPAGKILLAEYGELNDSNRARVALLDEKLSPVARANVRLIHTTAGFTDAGSAARWENGGWRVNWHASTGGIHGKRFLPENETGAREYFDSLTKARISCARGHTLHYSGTQTAYCFDCHAYMDTGTGARLEKQPF